MLRRTALVLLSSVTLFTGATLFGADAHNNYAGNWKLDVTKSDFGPIPMPDKLTRTIDQTEPDIKVVSNQTNAQGDVSTTVLYNTEGKETVNKSPRGDGRSTAKWVGKELHIETKREVQSMDITVQETWTLSDDGKTMIDTSHIVTPQGEFDIKMTFDKQ